MMPGILSSIDLQPIAGFLNVVIVALLGLKAESIFKAKAFGKWIDVGIALIGAAIAYIGIHILWSGYYQKMAEAFYADLFRRGIESMGRYPDTLTDFDIDLISYGVGFLLAALLLWLVRRLPSRKASAKAADVW